MEVALLHSSADQQSNSGCKRVKNPKRNTQARSFITSRSRTNSGNLYFENLPQMEMMMNGGVFLNPSFPLSSSLPRLNSSPYPLQFHQPPLLPSPMASSSSSRQFRSLPTCGTGGGGGGGGVGGSSFSPTQRKQNKGNKDQTKSKPPKQVTSPQKVAKGINIKQYPAEKSDLSTVGKTKRLGPDPDSLPKNVTKGLFGDNTTVIGPSTIHLEEKFSGSVFPLAPPPSSLPMPKFSLKPKLSCKVEASGADAGRVNGGATDNLCQLLNLR